MKRFLLFVMTIMLSLTLFACSGGGEDAKKATISIDKATLSIVVGGEATLVATTENTTEATVWTSSDPTVASVNGGLVAGLKAGETTITASVAGVSDTCVVTVTEGYAITLTATGEMVVNENQTLVWTIKNNGELVTATPVFTAVPANLVSVTTTGEVTALASGTVKITATYTVDGKAISANATIVIKDVKDLKLAGSDIFFRELGKTKTAKFEAWLNGAIDTTANIEYSVADGGVATVNATTGVVTSVAVGATTLTATWGDAVKTCDIVVDDITTYDKIGTKAQFETAFLATNTDKTVNGKKYLLTADIDLAGISMGVGQDVGKYLVNGTLDGNGFFLKNIKADYGYMQYAIKLGDGATIRNIGFDCATGKRYSNGVFFKQAGKATMENIIFNMNLTEIAGDHYDSSILIGKNSGTIKNLIMNVELVSNDNLASLNGAKFGAVAFNNVGTIENVYCNFTKYGMPYQGEIKLVNSGLSTNVMNKTEEEMFATALFDGWDSEIWAVSAGIAPVLRQDKAIMMNKSKVRLFEGDTKLLVAIQSGSEAVTWSSSSDAIATVANGTVTAVANGVATITASIGADTTLVTTTCEITVKDVYTFSLNKNDISLKEVGETNNEIRLFATDREIPNGDMAKYTWLSGNNAVATVDSLTGVITAVGAGKTDITVTYNGLECIIHVNVELIATLNQIFNVADFEAIGTDATTLGKSYILMNDIDFGGATKQNLFKFAGVLDGNGFSIKNFVVKDWQKYFISLSDTATVRNVVFNYDIQVQSEQSLFGTIPQGATVKDCIFNMRYLGNTAHTWYTAGVAFENNGDITNCIVNVSKKADSGTITDRWTANFIKNNGSNALAKDIYVTNPVGNALVAEAGGTITNVKEKTDAEILDHTQYTGWNTTVWDIDPLDTRAPMLKKNLPVMIDKFSATIYLVPNQTNTTQITITKDEGVTDAVTCTSSDPLVATVDNTGLVTAVAVGTTKISIKCGWVTLTCDITVSNPVVISLGATAMDTDITTTSSLTMPLTLKVEGVDADAAVLGNVVWDSSDKLVATVNAGVVTILTEGTTNITAKYTYAKGSTDYTATCALTVLGLKDYVRVGAVKEFKDIFATENSAKGRYILTNDIDFGGVTLTGTTFANALRGVIDGNGYAIKNFQWGINYNGGLFKLTKTAIIRNIEIAYLAEGGGNCVGIFNVIPAGAKLSNIIFTVEVTKVVYGNDCAGILIKTNEGTLENIIANFTMVEAYNEKYEDANFGAIVNSNAKGVMTNVYATAVKKTDKTEWGKLALVATKRWVTTPIGAGTQTNVAKKSVADMKKHTLYEGWDAKVWNIDSTDTNLPTLKKADIREVKFATDSVSIDKNSTGNKFSPLLLNGVIDTTAGELAKMTFTSSAQSVATIDNNGALSILTVGTTIITATYTDGSLVLTDTIEVIIKEDATIALDKTTLAAKVGDATTTLVPTLTVGGVAGTPDQISAIVWTTNKEGVATVAAGVVTIVGAGEATITATYTANGIAYTATCVVTVTAAA